jgi:hypothetical protein
MGPEQLPVEAQVAAVADEGLEHAAADVPALSRCGRLIDALEGRRERAEFAMRSLTTSPWR